MLSGSFPHVEMVNHNSNTASPEHRRPEHGDGRHPNPRVHAGQARSLAGEHVPHNGIQTSNHRTHGRHLQQPVQGLRQRTESRVTGRRKHTPAAHGGHLRTEESAHHKHHVPSQGVVSPVWTAKEARLAVRVAVPSPSRHESDDCTHQSQRGY